ncbi:MAG: GntR family transcriptional regulator [Alphaproteobacteria bacterium]
MGRTQGLREQLEDDIVMGRYRPGERLDEVSLARRFGVSRTPIREVIIQLAESGLLEMRPHRGAYVASVGPREMVEIFEVMAELEGLCGRLAARRIEPEELDRLRALHEDCAAAIADNDPDAYYFINGDFHDVIYQASRNAYLAEQARNLHRRLRVYRRLQFRVGGRLRVSHAEHEAIIAALAAHDQARANALCREHVLVQGERFSDLVSSLAELAEGRAVAERG